MVIYSTSSCEWPSILHHLVCGSLQHHLVSCFCRSVVEGGGSEQHKGPQSLFVEGLLEGGGENGHRQTLPGCFGFVARIFQLRSSVFAALPSEVLCSARYLTFGRVMKFHKRKQNFGLAFRLALALVYTLFCQKSTTKDSAQQHKAK